MAEEPRESEEEVLGKSLIERIEEDDGLVEELSVDAALSGIREYLLKKEREVALVAAEAERWKNQVKELSDLVNMAAHELRHPATLFKGYAEILLDQGGELDEETVKESLVAIDGAANRLSHLVSELVDAARIERGELTLSKREISPWALIATSVEAKRALGTDNEFNIGRRQEEESDLEVDPDSIRNVILTLLDNAVKYSPAGSTIDVWYEQEGDTTVFYVADKGPGIPEEERDKIFDRFYRVEDALHQSEPGLGLGLYLASEIVEAHGGWIRVDAGEEEGSVFSFGI